MTTKPCSDAAAVILNGGKARRMHSQDKSRLVLAGRTILDRQLAVLRPRFSHIAMVGGAAQEDGVHSLVDREGGKGPLDGIAAALAWSPMPWVFVLASDMPCIEPALVDLLLRRRTSEAHLVGASIDGRAQPLLALYHRSLLATLDACLARTELRASELLLHPPAGVTVTLLSAEEVRLADANLRSFQNLNTPEDVLTSAASIE